MKWITVLVCLWLVLTGAQAYNDARCTERGGRCQYTSSACDGGSYVRNLCGGPYNRRCCVSSGWGWDWGWGCSKKVKDLACELFSPDGDRIAAKRHPSGQKDNAYPYNNLRDVCNGGKASRSSYRCSSQCHAPGGSTCLSPKMLKYLVDLKNSGKIWINELAGACHSCTSRHYSGLAVDLHKFPGHYQRYMKACTDAGGWALEERNHVHCQFYDTPHPNWEG
ncbi:uncharacterized protein LOC143275273 [Babylonia areolata]|uniref:uncharacterized protein LOC143275273 n=1 Tax=Babylonia areolata TaxID=304850 RepID=UPI003FD039F8